MLKGMPSEGIQTDLKMYTCKIFLFPGFIWLLINIPATEVFFCFEFDFFYLICSS